MIIYVFDERWTGRFQPASTHRTGTEVRYFTVLRTHTISQIVQMIRHKAVSQRSIWLLRLCGHGNAGWLDLGADPGLDVSTAGLFAPLREYFTPDGRGIELHGCAVASATLVNWMRTDEGTFGTRSPGRGAGSASPSNAPGLGYLLLRALANSTGVPVTAGIDLQDADRRFRWEGRGTLKVAPGAPL